MEKVETVAESSPEGPKKKTTQKDRRLTAYNKKCYLEYMQINGTGTNHFKATVNLFPKVPAECIIGFINSEAKMYSEKVSNEVKSKEFAALDSWATEFKDRGFRDECGYEYSVLFRKIADTGKHPEPSEAGGIDFKALYMFLSNTMLGSPTPALNGSTKAFLNETYRELLEMVENHQGKTDVATMKISLQDESIVRIRDTQDPTSTESFIMGLNPLRLDN